VIAEWFLWVYCAYWKLTVLDDYGKKKLSATSSSTSREKKKICRFLCGQRLSHINIDCKTGKTTLLFDLGAKLVLRRPRKETKELWLLYTPNGEYLSIHGNGTYDYKPSSDTDTRPTVENTPIPKDIIIGPKII